MDSKIPAPREIWTTNHAAASRPPVPRPAAAPRYVATHEEVTESRELFAGERFGEEICSIQVGSNMEHPQQPVSNVVTHVVPARFESLVVDVQRGIVGGEDRPFVVAKDRDREL